MSETEGKKGPAIYVHGGSKPKAPEGYKYIPEFNKVKRNQIVGWKLISATGHSDPEGFLVPPELEGNPTQGFPSPEDLDKSRKKHFPSIEDSLPRGDRD